MKKSEDTWEKYEQDLIERNKLKTEVGDIIIVSDDMPFRLVQIGLKGKDKHPFGLLCLKTHSIELWSQDGDFKIGDELFGPNMIVTSIIKKKTFEMLKNL